VLQHLWGHTWILSEQLCKRSASRSQHSTEMPSIAEELHVLTQLCRWWLEHGRGRSAVVRVTSSYLRVLTRKAGSLRWEGWVSCDTRGLGGRESLAICLRYPQVAPRGCPLNFSLYLFNSMAATWVGMKQLLMQAMSAHSQRLCSCICTLQVTSKTHANLPKLIWQTWWHKYKAKDAAVWRRRLTDEIEVQDAATLCVHIIIRCSSQVGYAPHATHTCHQETRDKAASCNSSLLMSCWAYLLQQHSVVSLKGLEDVMVATQGSKPVHGGIAMPSTTLTASGQRLRCVLGGICLQACMASIYFAWLSSLTATLAHSDTAFLYSQGGMQHQMCTDQDSCHFSAVCSAWLQGLTKCVQVTWSVTCHAL